MEDDDTKYPRKRVDGFDATIAVVLNRVRCAASGTLRFAYDALRKPWVTNHSHFHRRSDETRNEA